MLFDVLIYPLPNSSYLLECDSSLRNNLIAHLRKYALRAKVSRISNPKAREREQEREREREREREGEQETERDSEGE